MSTKNLAERILSDARAEAQTIIEEAEKAAANLLAEASSRSEQLRLQTEQDVKEKTDKILEKRAADARLECSKISLLEKRKVLDSAYELALNRLIALDKEDALALAGRLLENYAEEGDELFFAKNFKYAEEVSALPIVEKKRLKISDVDLPLDGGMRLVGRVADKDLSYGALLSTDRENHQAKLAKSIFKSE